MDKITEFRKETEDRIQVQGCDEETRQATRAWFLQASKHKYSFNYSWMGRPIIQHPQDMIARQELMWAIKPDLIIETGIAHGGSIIMSAGLQEMIGIENGNVIGIDIDIRSHNRAAIEAHPMYKRITMIEGSSVDPDIIKKVQLIADKSKCVMVFLDSNHTHEHVLAELNAYAPMVSVGSYCVVYDTTIEDYPEVCFDDRPWGTGNNPKTAVREFLQKNNCFEVDTFMDSKLLISDAPEGYLKRVK